MVTFGQNPAFGRVLTAAILPNLLNKDVLCTFWQKLTTRRSTLGPLCVVIGQLWQKHCREGCHSQGLTRHLVNILSTFGQLWSTLVNFGQHSEFQISSFGYVVNTWSTLVNFGQHCVNTCSAFGQCWPTLVNVGQLWSYQIHTSQVCVQFWSTLINSGQLWSTFGQLWSTLVNHGQRFDQRSNLEPRIWSTLVNSWSTVKIGQLWSTLVNFGQLSQLQIHPLPDVVGIYVNFGQSWSASCQHVVNIWSTVVNFGPAWSVRRVSNPDFPRFCQPVASIGQLWSTLVNVGQQLVNFGQLWSTTGNFWPMLKVVAAHLANTQSLSFGQFGSSLVTQRIFCLQGGPLDTAGLCGQQLANIWSTLSSIQLADHVSLPGHGMAKAGRILHVCAFNMPTAKLS